MTDPILGPPPTDPGCAHAMTFDGHTCGRDPVVHIATHSDATGVVELPSCRRHAALARVTADVIAEHDYTDQCGTGGCWTTNTNRVIGTDWQPRRTGDDLRWPTVAFTGLIRFWSLVALMLLMLGVAHALGGRP